MRAYRDPTADAAIANVMREMKMKKGHPNRIRKNRDGNNTGTANNATIQREGRKALPFHVKEGDEDDGSDV